MSRAFLERFVAEFGVRSDEPTYKVCDRLVKVHTKEHRCCYFALLAGACEEDGTPWSGQQNVFVSHSWGCPFLTLLATLREHERKHQREGVHYYYVDLFGLNQHDLSEINAGKTASKREAALQLADRRTRATSRCSERSQRSESLTRLRRRAAPLGRAVAAAATSKLRKKQRTMGASVAGGGGEGAAAKERQLERRRWLGAGDPVAQALLEALDFSIEKAARVLVVIDKGDNLAPLGRVWCLYEIWRATQTYDRPVHMGFPADEAVRFVEGVRAKKKVVDNLNDNVDVRKANATDEGDK